MAPRSPPTSHRARGPLPDAPPGRGVMPLSAAPGRSRTRPPSGTAFHRGATHCRRGSAGLPHTPFRERRRRAPDTRPLPRSEPRPASRRGRGAGIVPDKVGGDALRNPHRRIAHRSLRQMRITRGRLDLRVTEQAPDHRQALPERQRP